MSADLAMIDVAEGMVVAARIDLLSDAGERYPADVATSEGAAVRVTVSQLDVQVGTLMTCRVMIEDAPYQVTVSVEEAFGHFDKRAVRLAVVSAVIAPRRRASPRAALDGAASLTAESCERIASGEMLEGVMHDLSEGGVGILVADLRPHVTDAFTLDLKFFEGAISQRIRVQSFRPGSVPGTLLLGCQFTPISSETLEMVKDLLARLDHRAADAGPSLRDKLGIPSTHIASPDDRRRWHTFNP